MKITIKKLQDIFPSINKIVSSDTLPILKKFKLKALAKASTNALREFQESIIERRKELGNLNDEGGYTVKREYTDQFYNEIKEMENHEIDLPDTKVILGETDIEKAKLSALDIANLDEIEEIIKIDIKTNNEEE